jgi:hypothetical protein
LLEVSAGNWIQIFGGLLILAGVTCILPAGLGVHPYSFTSPFNYFVQSGAFLGPGGILIGLGSVVILVSFVSWFD